MYSVCLWSLLTLYIPGYTLCDYMIHVHNDMCILFILPNITCCTMIFLNIFLKPYIRICDLCDLCTLNFFPGWCLNSWLYIYIYIDIIFNKNKLYLYIYIHSYLLSHYGLIISVDYLRVHMLYSCVSFLHILILINCLPMWDKHM